MAGSGAILVLDSGAIRVISASRDSPRTHFERDIEPDEFEHWWSEDSQTLDEAVKEAFDESQIPHGPVTVAYKSAQCTVDFMSFPVQGSAARSAAMLAVSESIALDPAVVVSDASGPLTASRGGASFVIGVADSSASIDRIVSSLHRINRTVSRVVPIHAWGYKAALEYMVGGSDPERNEVLVLLGEGAAYIGACIEGVPVFIRSIEIGLRSFSAPLRELRSRLTLDEECSDSSLIRRIGIPMPNDAIPGAEDLSGKDILPLIQPVIQRLIVEVRQSLRFGVAREHHELLELRVHALGGDVPGLDRAMVHHLELSPSSNESPVCKMASTEAMLLTDPGVRLVSGQMRASSARRHSIAALIAGGVLAGALMAADAYVATTASVDAESQLSSIRADLEQVSAAEAHTSRAVERLRPAVELVDRIEQLRGAMPAWGASLGEVASRRPPGVVLTSVRGEMLDGEPILHLTGLAKDLEGDAGLTEIRQYVASLMDSPLIQEAALDRSTRTQADGVAAINFEIVLTLLSLPPEQEGAES